MGGGGGGEGGGVECSVCSVSVCASDKMCAERRGRCEKKKGEVRSTNEAVPDVRTLVRDVVREAQVLLEDHQRPAVVPPADAQTPCGGVWRK